MTTVFYRDRKLVDMPFFLQSLINQDVWLTANDFHAIFVFDT